jgi:glyoxylase-like metal-dependent hydrolase (beta-lactamase superfamily II)
MEEKSLPKIENLQISKVTDNVLLGHQIKPPYYFSCSDGLILLPKKDRNSGLIILDLNIEPYIIDQLNDFLGPVEKYICTHGHMDHMAHVHHWETIGAKIFAPIPESSYLLNIKNFYKGYEFSESLDFSIIKKFGELNRYHPCKAVNSFKPGKFFDFDGVKIETISFSGHSKSHIGFFIPQEQILHISCLGFDQITPGAEGFGPWYGFKECSIDRYLNDIDLAEEIFLKRAEFLTSSHSYIVKNPDMTPFNYMREKILKNQAIIDQAIISLKKMHEPLTIDNFLELDLFFPKKKMDKFRKKIYRYWESGIIKKHLKRSKSLL